MSKTNGGNGNKESPIITNGNGNGNEKHDHFIVEVHFLQSFPPSCMNADDAGNPKACSLGGVRRGRISSQCIQHAIREWFREHASGYGITPELFGIKSKFFVVKICDLLYKKSPNHAPEKTTPVVNYLLRELEFKMENKDKNRLSTLAFLTPNELSAFVECCLKNWEALEKAQQESFKTDKKDSEKSEVKKKDKDGNIQPTTDGVADSDDKESAEEGETSKKAKKQKLDPKIVKEFKSCFDGNAIDVALCGRTLTNMPDKNVRGAIQMAHSYTTHAVMPDQDYFSSCDELNKDDETGAGHIGNREFNSGVHYRYMSIDRDLLAKNMNNNFALADIVIKAWLTASYHVVPSGRQHSMASPERPALAVFVVRRNTTPCSVGGMAFTDPVSSKTSVLKESIERFDKVWTHLKSIGCIDNIVSVAVLAAAYPDSLDGLKGDVVANVEALIKKTIDALKSQ
jgi:CRISPR system Cascade subunit CasC